MPQKILITYFGAFEGVAENPTAYLANELQLWAHAELPDTRLITAELPVIFGESRTELSRVLERERPDAVISLGVAVGRDKVSLERVAINCDDARIADNSGHQLRDTPIVPGAPAAYFSTLPIREIFNEAEACNLPVEISNTAGTFVCNHVFYALMHSLAGTGIPAGFIHVPALKMLSLIHI